jgi:hypothetical protein
MSIGRLNPHEATVEVFPHSNTGCPFLLEELRGAVQNLPIDNARAASNVAVSHWSRGVKDARAGMVRLPLGETCGDTGISFQRGRVGLDTIS